MKRSTANWTTAIAASALLAMPVGSWAQETSPTPPSQTTSRPSGAPMDQQGSANEHLRLAEAALNDIPAASLTGTAKSRVAELRRHITTLDRSASSAPADKPGTSASPGKANWSSEVAAADRILTELLGAQGTTGASEPAATGTTGTSGKPAGGSKAGAATIDEATRTKLLEVRTHLTAFAATMSGGSGTPKTSTPSADDPSSSASASATSSTSAAAAPSSSTSASSSPASTSSPASASSSPYSSSASSSSPAATSPSTSQPPQSEPSATPSAQAQGEQTGQAQSVDAENVKRHLTAARESLSQLTQLPAAAQLTGDARTQVSQLITNFNELITTNTNWRASYDKLQANLTALVGDQRADESAAAPAAGTAGAVGTSGTTALDPTIRAKLVEFRAHLMDFEKAAGGGAAASSSSTPPASPAPSSTAPDSTAAAASTTSSSATSPSAPASTTASSSSASTSSPSSSSTPSPAATSGSSATPSATAGTSGTTSSTPTPTDDSSQSSPAQPKSAQAGHSDAMRHIEAIEAILNGSSAATAGTSGSAESRSKGAAGASSLDRAQIEQIRTHLAQLRKALDQSSK